MRAEGGRMNVLQTERLRIRHLVLDDLADVHRTVYADPDVCRYYCGQTRTLEHTERWLRYRGYESVDTEFGLMAVTRLQEGDLLGLCGLQPYVGHWLLLEGEPEQQTYAPLEIELNYAFGKAYWGRGYAHEACLAMIDYAFREQRLRRLVTGCHPENARARRLQDRLGMRQVRNLHPRNPGTVGILDNLLAPQAGRRGSG
jgi:RimJ/RimL family protein N-acetyltransferase